MGRELVMATVPATYIHLHVTLLPLLLLLPTMQHLRAYMLELEFLSAAQCELKK